MANTVSLQNCKRFERHHSGLQMRVLKASVALMKLSDTKRDGRSAEITREKPLTKEC